MAGLTWSPDSSLIATGVGITKYQFGMHIQPLIRSFWERPFELTKCLVFLGFSEMPEHLTLRCWQASSSAYFSFCDTYVERWPKTGRF